MKKRWFLLVMVLLISSAWYSLGARKLFRVGLGALGFIPSDLEFSGIPFIFYGGFKVVL
jgi:hypothetical protein